MFIGPRNRFQGMNSASLCSLAGRYDNPIPPRFLAPIDFLKIPALHSIPTSCALRLNRWCGSGFIYCGFLSGSYFAGCFWSASDSGSRSVAYPKKLGQVNNWPILIILTAARLLRRLSDFLRITAPHQIWKGQLEFIKIYNFICRKRLNPYQV